MNKTVPVSKSSSLTGSPSFIVHILDPTGQLAIGTGTGTFTSVAANALQYVSVRLSQTGTHFIRVVNQTTGQTIQVTSFDVTR